MSATEEFHKGKAFSGMVHGWCVSHMPKKIILLIP
jgi:hypothetical protein